MYQNRLACTWKSAVVLGSMGTTQLKSVMISTDLAHGKYRCWLRVGFLPTLYSSAASFFFQISISNVICCNLRDAIRIVVLRYVSFALLLVQGSWMSKLTRVFPLLQHTIGCFAFFFLVFHETSSRISSIFGSCERQNLSVSLVPSIRIKERWKSRKTRVFVVPIDEKHHPSAIWARDFTISSNWPSLERVFGKFPN